MPHPSAKTLELAFTLFLLVQEDRRAALKVGLDGINSEIAVASRNGVAIWFPMGSRNERIVRLATKEATILNSRFWPVLKPPRQFGRHTHKYISCGQEDPQMCSPRFIIAVLSLAVSGEACLLSTG